MVNMGVNVNLFPTTGVTLPLISMGGSSLWFTCFAIGIILSVARNVEQMEGRAALRAVEQVNETTEKNTKNDYAMENENIINKIKNVIAGNGIRIIIAGGGTGGHIFPAIAIAVELEKQNEEIKILFVGAKGKMEMEKIPEAGYEIIGLTIAGYNRSSLIRNISLPLKLVQSFFQVTRDIKKF